MKQTYDEIHQSISDKMHTRMPEHLDRLTWKNIQIVSFQQKQLKKLLRHVRVYSPYYQTKLVNIPVEAITLESLQTIPPSTKEDVMKYWDDIVCVKGLTRAKAENYLAKQREGKEENPFYQDQYYINATGGSSGNRGLFVWDRDYFATVGCATFRYQLKDENTSKPTKPVVIAVIVAPSLVHASRPLFSLSPYPKARIECISADESLDRIARQLNDLQPSHIIGYTSVITELSHLSRKGKLSIQPIRISTNSEPLDTYSRHYIEQAWNVKVHNMWGSVEMGIVGVEDDSHQGLFLSDDLVIIEPVNHALQPALYPEEATKLLVTNLFNQTFPLIRYVVDDCVEIIPSYQSGYRIATDIKGRTDDWFKYGDIKIHPMVFRHVLGQHPAIAEYQVKQTRQGAVINLVTNQTIDSNQLTQALLEGLQSAGLEHPKIEIQDLPEIPRHPETGKLVRFIALK